MLEFDACELDRRERIDTEMENMAASLRTAAQNEETERRKGYDRSRDLVLEALNNNSALFPCPSPAPLVTRALLYGSPDMDYPSPDLRPFIIQSPPSLAEALRQEESRENFSNPPGFRCAHPGCTAAPFQTQYLLK
jgi:hypothetical protein